MIRWGRSDEGFVKSKCRRFWITPNYCGTTRPQDYNVWDEKVKRDVLRMEPTIQAAKEATEEYLKRSH